MTFEFDLKGLISALNDQEVLIKRTSAQKAIGFAFGAGPKNALPL